MLMKYFKTFSDQRYISSNLSQSLMANFSLFVFTEYELSVADVLNDIMHSLPLYSRV